MIKKYDLGKLTRKDVVKIIKNIGPTSFANVYCYTISHQNQIRKNLSPKKDGIVELFDKVNSIHDQWGEYNINDNSLFVMIFDYNCFWEVGIYLYEDHFEIPKYKNGFREWESEENFKKYRELLNNIFHGKINTSNAEITK